MYTMTCDGYPLLDTRDDKYVLGSPRVKNEVNTVGEGSFKIYFNHPNIDTLKPLLSLFEVKDDFGVIFRGRMTEDTKDIDNGIDVDLEGVMSYFNDSVIRPYVFPDDFKEDAEYQAAAKETPEQAANDGGVVRFLLKWYIDRHNEQVEDFQKFKLGNVTVYDKNNFIERAASTYPSTWKEIEEKLFNSSLGGYLCIRYEDDGNYIDYLREFTETNEQTITYGENMLEISQNTDASGTYSAIVPLGAEQSIAVSDGEVYEGVYGDITGGETIEKNLTIEELPDGDITDDIVKKGDMLYSKEAVAAYGLRIAPTDETTWDDVETPENLQSRGVEYLKGDSAKIPKTIKVTAVDLNCTDSQIMSFRMYKRINVYASLQGVSSKFDLTALDIDLLNPQNNKITVGNTVLTLTKYPTKEQSNLKRTLGGFATKKKVDKEFENTAELIEEVLKRLENIEASLEELQKKTEAIVTEQEIEKLIEQVFENKEVITKENLEKEFESLFDQALADKEVITEENLEEKLEDLGYTKDDNADDSGGSGDSGDSGNGDQDDTGGSSGENDGPAVDNSYAELNADGTSQIHHIDTPYLFETVPERQEDIQVGDCSVGFTESGDTMPVKITSEAPILRITVSFSSASLAASCYLTDSSYNRINANATYSNAGTTVIFDLADTGSTSDVIHVHWAKALGLIDGLTIETDKT